MPFGEDGSFERRLAILNFKRLEYIVRSKCEVTTNARAGEGDRVTYAVETARTWTESVLTKVLKQIEDADILIGLVVGSHPNVIYELAFRRARAAERPTIIVVDSEKNLPLYEKWLGRQSWAQPKVLEKIDDIAKDDDRPLSDFTVGIPDDLKKRIDTYDDELQKYLESALQEIESHFEPYTDEAVQHLRGIVSEKTTSFYPCSIVEYEFLRHGEFANPQAPGIVRYFDDAFSRLYGYASKSQAQNDIKRFTLAQLLNKIEPFLDKSHWKEFVDDQEKLASTVIKSYGLARAKVPLRFNDMHAEEFSGKSYLPCAISQVVDGDPEAKHTMHVLVVYVEVPTSVAAAVTTS